jgi:hypothetical protein
MTQQLATVAPEVPRDHMQRPLVIPPDGGDPVPYTRASSFDVLEDTYNLHRWDKRMVAKGFSLRPDLLLAVTATDVSEKKKLDGLCDEAKEAAKASAAATTGTALHKLTEYVDLGQELPVLPADSKADLDAYAQTMRQVTVEAIEQFVVCDELKAAGTFDRIVSWQGQRFVADIKTGSIKYGVGKIAQQLAIYSRGLAYDPRTGDRTSLEVDQRNALIIHLPAGTGTCELVWLDIATGWELAQLSAQVRAARRGHQKLTAPFAP